MRLRPRLAVAVAAKRPATEGRRVSCTLPLLSALRDTIVKAARGGSVGEPPPAGPPPPPPAPGADPTSTVRARVAGAPLHSVAWPVKTVALHPPVPATRR